MEGGSWEAGTWRFFERREEDENWESDRLRPERSLSYALYFFAERD